MHIEYDIKNFNDLEIAISKKVEVGATMPNECTLSMQELRAGMLQQQAGFKSVGQPIPMYNNNPKIIRNKHLCGQIAIGKIKMTLEWEDVDNITEADVNEYHEYAKTSPIYGTFDYDLDKCILEGIPSEAEITEWHDGAVLNYLLNVPKLTTHILDEDAKLIFNMSFNNYDFRQKDIAPNGEQFVEKKTTAGFEEDTYLYLHRPTQIDGTDYDEDTFILQSNDATIKNLTNKPNRIVQFWKKI